MSDQQIQRGVLQAVLNTIRLARDSHGIFLASEPPQEAWKARQVDAKLADAASLLERLVGDGQAVESVSWIKCDARMPDAELTVYAYLPPDELDSEGMVISAFFDGEQWRGASDGWPLGKAVTWWAEELQGPLSAGNGEGAKR